MSFPIRTGLVAAVLASALTVAHAQTTPDQDHAAHHPEAQTAVPPAQGPAMRMQGQQSMGPRGPQQIMMGGGSTSMTQMMQMMMPMMRTMMMSDGAGGTAGTMAMMQPSHIEGRIAFLRTELKVTDAQSPLWNAFADALRQGAKGMMTMREGMMNRGAATSAPELAEREVSFLSARLEAMKAIAAAETTLYAALSEDQKKTADELLVTPMGRM